MEAAQISTEYAIPVTPEPEPETYPVACKNEQCQHVIGEARLIGKRFYLVLGGVPWYALHGKCPKCGATIHWTDDDAKLARLVKRVKHG
jgi:hypothetical protein